MYLLEQWRPGYVLNMSPRPCHEAALEPAHLTVSLRDRLTHKRETL